MIETIKEVFRKFIISKEKKLSHGKWFDLKIEMNFKSWLFPTRAYLLHWCKMFQSCIRGERVLWCCRDNTWHMTLHHQQTFQRQPGGPLLDTGHSGTDCCLLLWLLVTLHIFHLVLLVIWYKLIFLLDPTHAVTRHNQRQLSRTHLSRLVSLLETSWSSW